MIALTAVDTAAGLVPLVTDFDVVLRGYDRGQVRAWVRSAEEELRLLADDRDALHARAESLTRHLEQARGRIGELSARLDRVCRAPVETDGLTERLCRMVELAHTEAAEITTRAEAAAAHHRSTAQEAAERLRRHHERMVAEIDARRARMEAEHRDLMRRAHEAVERTTREAERTRRALDDRAARLREQADADFRIALAARRAEADRHIAELMDQAHERAEQCVRQAREQAERMVAEARHQVELLDHRRERLAAALRETHRALSAAEPLLTELPEETAAPPALDRHATAA